MLTWCSRAVNFNSPSFLAASRTRRSPLDPLSRLGVRHGLGSGVFSLANGLPSTPSAGDSSLLFGCFAGTMPLYDSSLPCTRDLPLIAFSLRPAALLAGGRQVSRFSRRKFLCMPGVSDSAGSPRAHVYRAPAVLLSGGPTPSASCITHFEALYPACRSPCPTLQARPHNRARMARGQSGSLLLLCTTLSFATSCRFIPTLSGPGGPPH